MTVKEPVPGVNSQPDGCIVSVRLCIFRVFGHQVGIGLKYVSFEALWRLYEPNQAQK
jgi:hypothetical protein